MQKLFKNDTGDLDSDGLKLALSLLVQRQSQTESARRQDRALLEELKRENAYLKKTLRATQADLRELAKHSVSAPAFSDLRIDRVRPMSVAEFEMVSNLIEHEQNEAKKATVAEILGGDTLADATPKTLWILFYYLKTGRLAREDDGCKEGGEDDENDENDDFLVDGDETPGGF